MKTMNLKSAPVSSKTASSIRNFVFENKSELSNDVKMFYQDVAGLIEIQISKPKTQRMTIEQILERAYNIDTYVLKTGAASFEQIFI